MFSFKKLKKNIIVFTKAPYRFKLSKHQVFFSRFQLFFSFFFTHLATKLNKSFLKNFFFFSSLDFCFFSLYYCKICFLTHFLEWLK
jgi:hypothetical protein